MCGGVIFPYRKIFAEMLTNSYAPEEIARFGQTGHVRSLFWQPGDPVLPVLTDFGDEDGTPGMTLLQWGNRDKAASLPLTGWARIESIEAGKWNYLKPKPVLIPATFGVEKGKWFPISNGIQGVLVQRDGLERVYMLTGEATPDFLDTTRHPRMPVLKGQSGFDWLPAEPFGINSAFH